MKLLLTYISPDKDFNTEHKMAVKIQIDNSLSLGWKREDIMLVTNFKYEFNGVESIIISDDNYCSHHWPATKIYVITHLFKMGLITDELYWYHDFDCFQLAPLVMPDLGVADMGLTNYGRMPRLCSASIFFKKTAGDIFEMIKARVDRDHVNEEDTLARLINNNPSLKKRVKHINLTYAMQKWNLWHSYLRADKPLQAVHFHLTPDKYDFFVNGNNRVSLKIIPEGLVDIFHKYGFKY